MAEVSPEYMAPKLRIVRSLSLEEDIRMLVSQATSFDQFLQAVKGTRIASKATRLATISDVEDAARLYHLSLLEKLGHLESVAPRIYSAYTLLAIGGYIASIIKRVVAGGEPPKTVTQHRLAARIAKIVSETGVRGLRPLLNTLGLVNLSSYLASTKLEPSMVDLNLDLDMIIIFDAALKEVGESRGVEHLCSRLDMISLRAAGNAALFTSRSVKKKVSETIRTCRLDEAKLRDLIEEENIDRIGVVLHGTVYQQYMSAKLPPVEAAYHAIRKYSRRRMGGSLASDPSELGFAAAILELIQLDIEDIIALATAAFAGLPRDVISDIVSVS